MWHLEQDDERGDEVFDEPAPPAGTDLDVTDVTDVTDLDPDQLRESAEARLAKTRQRVWAAPPSGRGVETG